MADLVRQWVWTRVKFYFCVSIYGVFILSILLHLISWQVLAFEIDSNVSRCGPVSLCRHQYPLNASFDTLLDPNLGWNTTAVEDDNESFRPCRCDPECSLYGDCCLDSAAVYGLHPNLTFPWVCLPMTMETDTSDQKYYMYMIGVCPTSDEETMSIFCQRRNDKESPYSHLIDIPVLSLATNRTYANIYCAHCHSDTEKLVNWNVTIQCNANINNFNVTREQMFHDDNYQRGSRRWILHTEDVVLNCVLVIEQLQRATDYLKSTSGRRCIPRASSCPPNLTDLAEYHKCNEIYTINVEMSSASPSVFKSTECAACTNLSTDGAICLDQNPILVYTPSTRRIPYSFSMIVDFSFGGYDEGQKKKCATNEIYDHLHGTCFIVSCGTQFIERNGVCLPRLLQPDERSSMSLNSSCTRITLIENIDYFSLENGSKMLNKTDRLIHPSSYEFDQNGTIQVCANAFSRSYLETLKNYLKYSYAQRLLSDVCLTISVVCLALHIGIHILVPKLRNLPGKILLSLSCSLFLGQFLFLTGAGARDFVGYGWCAAVAAVIHWSILAAFFWMNIMAFDICRTFAGSQMKTYHHRASVHGRQTSFRFYSIYGWTCPTLVVGLALILDFTTMTDRTLAPEYGLHQCWICNKYGLGLFFVLPMSLLLTANFVFFTVTAWSILKQWREAQRMIGRNQPHRTSGVNSNSSDKLKTIDQGQHCSKKSFHRLHTRFYLYVKLALIMGLGWISAFVAGLADIPGLWYPFILLNTLQGTFIFLAFDCKRKVYYMVYEAVTKRPHPSNSWSSTRGLPYINQPAAPISVQGLYNTE